MGSINQLTSINLTQNTDLITFYCTGNQITSLDVTQNTILTELRCGSNFLTCLNVKNGNNLNFMIFGATSNPNLTCIQVDDTNYSNLNWVSPWIIDSTTSFSTICSNSCLVGIEENKLNSFLVYPNPTTGSINIDIEETLRNPTVTITNNLGQVVLTKNYNTTSFISLDIDAPKGIYFLQLQTESRKIITQKIVKE